MRDYFQRNRYEFIFAGLLVLMMLAYSFPYLISQGPKGFHMWRQTDGLSFTRHYYDNGLDFSDPQISHLLFQDYTSAKTVGEFPGVYYLVACLWKIFGIHEWIFRLVTLLITLGGLLSAHKLIREITQQPFWTSWIVALLFTSPAVVFYSAGFIPDMHAISFSLMACLLFYRYVISGKISWLYFAALTFALAGIIKPTALIPFAALGAILLIETITKSKLLPGKWFHSVLHGFVAFAMVVVINLAWVLWVRHYNDSNGGWFTPHALFFPWNYSPDVLRNFISMFREFLVNQLFSRSTLFLLIAIMLLMLFVWKNSERRSRAALLLMVTGCATYVLMFFKWDVHDYYALVLIPLPLVVLATALRTAGKEIKHIIDAKPLRYLAVVFLLYNVWYCASNLQMRIHPKNDKLYLSSASKPEVELFKYLMWSYDEKFASMTEAESYLNSIGVGEDDLIVSLPDDSFNASLYFMHRKGWTSYEREVYTVEGMQKRIQRGARFLVVNDLKTAMELGLPQELLTMKVGEFKNLVIYRLSD